MIDRATGIVTINADLVIDPSGVTGLLAPPADPRSWEHLWPQPVERVYRRPRVVDAAGRAWAVTIYVEKARVARVDLFAYLPDEPEQSAWTSWSPGAELRRMALHEAVVQAALGQPPYTYAWGTVQPLYDAKGGFSLLVITYTPPGV